MYKQVEKSKENKSRTVANSVAQKKNNGRQGFDFVDNRPKNTVAQLMLPAGKKGGAYFSRSGYTKEQVAKAQESVGMTSGHGSGKAGSSRISAKTKKEEQVLLAELRKQKKETKASNKPKAVIHNQGAKSDYEKAKIQAETKYLNNAQGMAEYLENRESAGASFTDDEYFDLMQIADPTYGN